MRFGPDGAPMVPQPCPVPQFGAPILDLRETAFKLGVEELSDTITSVWGKFNGIPQEDGPRSVETEVLLLPSRMVMAQQLRKFAIIPDPESNFQRSWIVAHPVSTKVGSILRRRVAYCDGVVEIKTDMGYCGMQCWALGQAALYRALTETMTEFGLIA